MDDISDSGGVAARAGFKFQDHVAAVFVLKMIGDRRIVQVECETSDDVTVIWQSAGVTYPEYVQVKSTDKDSKWSTKEITARTGKTLPTSLVEKSLLADKHGENARFRIVARRAVGKVLLPLMDAIATRNPGGPIGDIAAKLKSKFPKTISKNGHGLDYWARNAYWEVLPGVEHLQHVNMQAISRTAEAEGANAALVRERADSL